MYIREKYTQWLQKYKNTPFIKVLTGMRRVGKSTILQQYASSLGIDAQKEMVLFIDMESLEFRHIKDAENLHNEVKTYFKNSACSKFIFIDEVQEIENWEKAVNSFLKSGEYDIYVTGSNAHLLSSDLATYLTGRYVQLEVYSLSYKEYLEINNQSSHSDAIFQRFLTFGGFPGLTHLPHDERLLFQTLNGLYSSIILRDVIERYQIRNTALLENMVHFFFDNIGNIVSAKKISDYCKSQKIKVSTDAVQNYIGYLASCFALYQVKRFDLKGKRYLEINEKHYLGDIGLRHATLGYRDNDIGQLLENIVYLELRRRGYKVSIGKLDTLEIDFIAERENERIYVQVSYLLATQETRKREFRPLKMIGDSYPKIVLTMDPVVRDEEGIQHKNLCQWLLDD